MVSQNEAKPKPHQFLGLIGLSDLNELRETTELLHEQNLRILISGLKYSR